MIAVEHRVAAQLHRRAAFRTRRRLHVVQELLMPVLSVLGFGHRKLLKVAPPAGEGEVLRLVRASAGYRLFVLDVEASVPVVLASSLQAKWESFEAVVAAAILRLVQSLDRNDFDDAEGTLSMSVYPLKLSDVSLASESLDPRFLRLCFFSHSAS
jgi:hypothetical protein